VDYNLESRKSPKLTSDRKKISIHSVFETVLLADWREEDLFQVPLLLYTLLSVDEKRIILSEDNVNWDERMTYKVRDR